MAVLILYNLMFPLLFLIYSPLFISKLLRRGGCRQNFGERFGIFSRRQRECLTRMPTPPVWIHAVSVGEVVAACSFIQRWQARDPNACFVLSTTTTTGHAMALKKKPTAVPLIYCPLDFHPFVQRALNLIRPSRLVIFEVEIWPNLISLAARRQIPVALVNGRLSDRSATGYARHRWLFAALFARIKLFCMQSATDAERVRRVVGNRSPVHVCNTMKFDQMPDPDTTDISTLLNTVFGPAPRLVWCAGSTHANEEALIADVFQDLRTACPELKLVLVPRHHERTAEIVQILNQRNLAYRLLQPTAIDDSSNNGKTTTAGSDILLVNTTGELMNFFRACDIAYVGKSLAGNHGGHNIIEPAIFAKPIVHGVNMENFRLVVELFRQRNASLEVPNDAELEPAIRQLCHDRNLRDELGKRARQVVDEGRGAIDRTIDILQMM